MNTEKPVEKTIWTLKAELKKSATEIHDEKIMLKKIQKGLEKGSAGSLQSWLAGARWSYRHRHIAYSLMRGRAYEQIEQKCAQGNEPNQTTIKRIIDEYSKKDVCACT